MAVKNLFVTLSAPGYATVARLLERFKLKELVELSCEGFVEIDLFKALLNNEDLSVFDPIQVDLAKQGLSKLCQACKDANSLIDDYLITALYDVPLENPPASIINDACDLTRYYLYGEGELKDGEPVWVRYREVIARLREIVKGDLVLNLVGEIAETAVKTISYQSATRVFTQSTLADY